MVPMSWIFVFFFVSGFCSILYELVWLRLAMAQFGVTTALGSIVLSAFMAGLGAGSLMASAQHAETLGIAEIGHLPDAQSLGAHGHKHFRTEWRCICQPRMERRCLGITVYHWLDDYGHGSHLNSVVHPPMRALLCIPSRQS
jgi:hypothetical protein